MAFKHGKDTEVLLNGRDISGYLNAADFAVDIAAGETTTFKKDWKTFIPGGVGATYALGGLYDTTVITDLEALIGDDPAAVLTVTPGTGMQVGDPCRLLKVVTTAHKESSPVGGIVAFAWSATGDGQVGFGKMVHPLAAEATDGDGGTTDYVDLGTAAAGAVAHLHVTAVSAGESIVAKVQDAATPTGGGADWADIAAGAGTFTSKSAVGAQRLVVAGTVRRYVRASWDITDNGGTVSVTFAVAIARLP